MKFKIAIENKDERIINKMKAQIRQTPETAAINVPGNFSSPLN
jgi:hypothetical protein